MDNVTGRLARHLCMRRRLVAFALVTVLLSIGGCTADTSRPVLLPARPVSPTTMDHPHACHLFDEGPSFLIRPGQAGAPASFAPLLRQQFQIEMPTALSPDAAIAQDPRVVALLQVRHEPDGMTYTEFQATSIGRTVITVSQRASPNGPAVTQSVTITVRCH